MDQVVNPPPTGAIPAPPDRRKLALFDILFLLVSVWAYAVSLFAPLVGIVLGVAFSNWGTTDETRRLGRICLILGIINIVLYLMLLGGIIAFGGLMSHLSPYSWEGL